MNRSKIPTNNEIFRQWHDSDLTATELLRKWGAVEPHQHCETSWKYIFVMAGISNEEMSARTKRRRAKSQRKKALAKQKEKARRCTKCKILIYTSDELKQLPRKALKTAIVGAQTTKDGRLCEGCEGRRLLDNLRSDSKGQQSTNFPILSPQSYDV